MPKMEMARFYNAGDRISDRFNYTKSDEDMRVSNCVGYFDMDAPSQGFFEVPREMRTMGGSQFVGLPKEVVERYGDRGVVMIDKNLTPEEALGEKWIADTEDTAKGKAHELWLAHCRKVVETFEAENENRAVRNMARMRPSNFTVHAYKVLGLNPPIDNRQMQPQAQPIAPAAFDMAAFKEQLKQELMAEMTAPAPVVAPAETRKGKSA